MASNQVMLLLFCGEMWSSLSAAAPQHPATTGSHTCTTATSPGADKPRFYQLQASGPSLSQSDRSLAATEPPAFPGEEEAGDGSWVAALIIGIILIGMMLAIIVILLWKCCMRPVLAESHWAGRSPFTDGDTPDLFMDSDQGTKRSSVLFMLPWRLKQGTILQEETIVSESTPQHTTGTENGQPLPPAGGSSGAGTAPASAAAEPCPPAGGCSGTGTAPASAAAEPCSPAGGSSGTGTAPASAAAEPCPPAGGCSGTGTAPASAAAEPCSPPDTPAEGSDLPPPPEWLRAATEEPSSGPSEHSALHLEAELAQPSPPELLIQGIHDTLPQLEHPL